MPVPPQTRYCLQEPAGPAMPARLRSRVAVVRGDTTAWENDLSYPSSMVGSMQFHRPGRPLSSLLPNPSEQDSGNIIGLLQCCGKDDGVNDVIETFDIESSGANQPTDWKHTLRSAANVCAAAFTQATAKLARYPRNKEDGAITTGSCIRTGPAGTEDHNFVLLCIPFMRLATKLYQPEICRINSDQEFLKLLRLYYDIKGGSSPWKLLRKVRSINFVKFELYRNDLTDIRLCPSVPPPERIGSE
ncbi:hypothetical protein B0H66DRAFT_600940 [Apodospora peruviana]|uniref:Uncharacterized protein n=1 Tax=Apodospora peruviana TaxID=516989 RepID=A0AAE0MBY8_9PEZI|nr:hypothetical protein B0H66DRAFT_600940 [Apodospora peruviana]